MKEANHTKSKGKSSQQPRKFNLVMLLALARKAIECVMKGLASDASHRLQMPPMVVSPILLYSWFLQVTQRSVILLTLCCTCVCWTNQQRPFSKAKTLLLYHLALFSSLLSNKTRFARHCVWAAGWCCGVFFRSWRCSIPDSVYR